MRTIQHFQHFFDVEMLSKEGYSKQGKKSEDVSTLSVHGHKFPQFCKNELKLLM